MPRKKAQTGPRPRREVLRERLEAEAAVLASAGTQALFDIRIGDLIDPAAAAEWVRAITKPESIVPLARRLIHETLDRSRKSDVPIGSRLPPGGEARLRELLGDPSWLSGDWVRKAAANDVLEEVMGTTLYEVLREFSLTVNPFFSSWGLPALLKKAGPLGKLGLFGVSLESGSRFFESMREEFERQLEPHIKTFLQKSARAALLRAVALAQSEKNLEAFARLRVRLLEDLLRRPASELKVDRQRLDSKMEPLLGLMSDALAQLRASDIEASLSAFRESRGQRTIRDELRDAELDDAGIQEALARALAPVVRSVMTSEVVLDRLESLVDGLS